MDKVGSARGLIRYASLNSIESGKPFRFTARMGIYAGVLCALITLFLVLVFTRPAVEAILLRAPGGLYQTTANGTIENLYTLKLVNKTMRQLPVQLKLENPTGTLRIMGNEYLQVAPAKLAETSVLIELDPTKLTGSTTRLKIGVYSNGKLLQYITTGFVGPRPDH